jgi:hypothetical protein
MLGETPLIPSARREEGNPRLHFLRAEKETLAAFDRLTTQRTCFIAEWNKSRFRISGASASLLFFPSSNAMRIQARMALC